ncbi:disintegrin and metalloproteinase domain-containing protein 21-like [Tachyglossus aculeatus]|uniref:disintegrin and metalloproteinase domain-containing protein 21-like n=1 Tax=Tachyglossus aculeatus TaxID=9261 RepID=UPI0018F3E33B|nr:disintegrin and metalloproteinase domain-containing protein 21-like [Tachyglossus aculeatus]
MGGAGVPGRLLLRALLVLLGLRTPPPARSARPEAVVVVVPRKVTPRGRAGEADVPGALSYVLPVDGQSRLLHLRPKKLLLAPRLPVFTYTDRGALTVDQPFVPDDCYYHGFVEGTPESLVALSTCAGGLRGMLQLGPLVYEIEPLPASAGFEHVLSRTRAGEPSPMKCGLTDDRLRSLRFPGRRDGNVTPRQGPTDGWWTHSRFLELAVVVDHGRFVYSRRNVTKVQEDVVNVVNVVDSLYRLLNLKISLVGIEIWTQRNLVDTGASLYDVLTDFSLWKLDRLYDRLPHDCAHLLVGRRFSDLVGLAFVGGICDPRAGSAVEAFTRDQLLPLARTVAHELGHNLGMVHDAGSCSCRRKLCIMHAFLSDAGVFSNCSYREYFSTITQGGLCLLDAPPAKALFRLERCGNRAVERGEQCDCGTPTECKWDLCCRTDCRLKAGADCASGPCCSACKIAPAGKLCRPQASECDLPEWCDGTSAGCPEDVFKQDGTPCGRDARCYRRRCGDRDGQCRALFGPEARGGPRACYEEVNTRGDRFGHCGLQNWHYHKCRGDDVLCGRVQCQDVRRLPVLADHTTVVQTALDGVTCWGTDYHVGMGGADVGDVKDGSACGPGTICIGGRCVGLSALRYDCEAERCHSRGVCNSKRHCHCHFGWAPPRCATRGFGGSIDSGPAAPDRLLPTICLILYTLAVFALFFFGTVFHPSLRMPLGPRPGRGDRGREAGRPGWRSYLGRVVRL